MTEEIIEEMIMTCPECKKEVKFKPVDKCGTIMGYRLEKLPITHSYKDANAMCNARYCIGCGRELPRVKNRPVCHHCKIKYNE